MLEPLPAPPPQIQEGKACRVIFASAAGRMIEWYDFYIFGSLATVITSKFYYTPTPLGDLIAWLATFAIVFGRIGELVSTIGLSLIKNTGNNFAGLWYPMIIAGICAAICYAVVPEISHVDIESDSISSVRETAPAPATD